MGIVGKGFLDPRHKIKLLLLIEIKQTLFFK